MSNFYFFRTVKIDERPRLRPLAGQTLPDGSAVYEHLNVQADSVMRGSYPLGTIFGSATLELRSNTYQHFYSTGAIYPMGLAHEQYIVNAHIPPHEMSEAWNEFRKNNTSATGQQETEQSLLDLFSNPITQTNIKKPKTLLEKITSEKKYAVPTIEKEGFYIYPQDWQLLVRNIIGKVNTLLIGPTGAGKTELVILACKKLGLDCSIYDMGSMYDPVAGLLGVHRLQKGGESIFDYAKFTQDIQKPGVVLLDELSRAPVTTNNILFPCLDSRRMLPVEMAGGDNLRSIPIHQNCVFVATANIGMEYTGTMSLDRALVGRFFPLELNYLPSAEETIVLTKRYDISNVDAANIVSVARTVRDLYDKQELSCNISTRETLMAASMVADGWSPLDAMQRTFLPLFEGTNTEGERSIVKKIFMQL